MTILHVTQPTSDGDDADRIRRQNRAWREYILEQILEQIREDLDRQAAGPGEQHHADGTGPRVAMAFGIGRMADHARTAQLACNRTTAVGAVTWMEILRAHFFAGMAESDWPQLRAKLIEMAATCAAWIEDGDSRD